MAYRNGRLTIDNFQRGMGKSSIVGFHEIKGIDIHDKIGIARSSLNSIIASGTSFSGVDQVSHVILKEPVASERYAKTNEGKLYQDDGNGTWTLKTGNTLTGTKSHDMVYWKGYLIFPWDNGSTSVQLDAWNVSTTAWTTSVSNISLTHYGGDIVTLVAQDGILYMGQKNNLMSFREKAGQDFDATNTTTFGNTCTVNTTALDLPEDAAITCMVELDKELLIGTKIANSNFAYIFPWDRLSQSYRLPIVIKGNGGIQAMVTIGNLTYFYLDNKLYATNGKSVSLLKELPITYLNRRAEDRVFVYRNAMTEHDGGVAFATSRTVTGTDWTAETGYFAGKYGSPCAIWYYRNGALSIIDTPRFANNTQGFKDAGSIRSLYSESDYELWSSWSDTDGADSGIDRTAFQANYIATSYTLDYNSIISELHQIAPKLSPKTFRELEVRLAKPLEYFRW